MVGIYTLLPKQIFKQPEGGLVQTPNNQLGEPLVAGLEPQLELQVALHWGVCLQE